MRPEENKCQIYDISHVLKICETVLAFYLKDIDLSTWCIYVLYLSWWCTVISNLLLSVSSTLLFGKDLLVTYNKYVVFRHSIFCHWIAIIFNLWSLYEKNRLYKNGAWGINQHDLLLEIIMIVYDDIVSS
jgi:hypothetical protein